jgi:nucleoporin NUP159
MLEGRTKQQEKRPGSVSQSSAHSLPSSSLDFKDHKQITPEPFVKSVPASGNETLLRTASPSQIPLPSSRSPSNERDIEPTPESARAGSTTPPGTPVKLQAPTPQKVAPADSPTSTSPFNLGLGRPNTRPTRSSPLASAPFSRTSEDSEEDQTIDTRHRYLDNEGGEEPAQKRMKTPPLLFSPSLSVKGNVTPPSTSPGSVGKGFLNQRLPQTPGAKPVFSLPLTPASPSSGNLPPVDLTKPPVFSFPGPSHHVQSTSSPFLPKKLSTTSSDVRPLDAMPLQVPILSPAPLTTPAPHQAALQPGLQTECAYLFASLAKELETLRNMAQDANKRCADLIQKDRIAQFERDISYLGGVVDQLGLDSKASSQALNRLESGMLKATTRREEVNRFAEAKRDGDFSKMLNSRTLGPDHLEAQKQLRSGINLVRDRIEKLEAHLAASKAKLNRAKTERAGLKAPSLDTINRTCRNIDLAIDNQMKEVHILKSRLSVLEIGSPPANSSPRDARLPDPVSRRPFNVTPHVAFTTAAALNAERSAQKFKHALLAARSEPLLNKTAKLASSTLSSFSIPQKLSDPKAESPTTPDFSNMTLGDFGDGKFQIGGGSPLTTRRGATSGSRKHHIIPLRRSPGAPQASSSPSFDWGPLPSFMPSSPSPAR